MDRRVRKTKRQLRIALMELMTQKHVNEISVRELADHADINRGTFYIHYKDVGDLLQQLEDEIADQLLQICRNHAENYAEDHSKYPFLTDLFRLIQDNADLCKVLLGNNGSRPFVERLCRIVYNNYLFDYLKLFYPVDERGLTYFCSFIVPGFLSSALAWLYGNGKETAEEMARLVGAIVERGAAALHSES